MVWSQYVYEATHGNEAEHSDNEYQVNIDEPLHINDWEEVHHEHLRYMWGILQQYLDDAVMSHFILKFAKYDDFVEFCFYNSEYGS